LLMLCDCTSCSSSSAAAAPATVSPCRHHDGYTHGSVVSLSHSQANMMFSSWFR
jgi:hypothetical protein